jgi:3-phosphoshikimate 1-carboxyvinyltransferase
VDSLVLAPIKRVRGTVRLPGSKSISNRTLLLAALARGVTTVRDVLDSDDTRHMLAALRALGVQVEPGSDGSMRITGTGGTFAVREADLFLGNAGTAFRPLTAALAVLGGDYRLSGVARMHERPIGDLVDALRLAGASIDYLGKEGYPPLHIGSGRIDTSQPFKVRGNVSSQFVTGLLMALPLTGHACAVAIEGELISKPYVDITINIMQRFGVEVTRQDWSRFEIPQTRGYLSPGEIFVEGDASSASYFLAAGAISGLTGGGPVRVQGIGRDSIQGDVRFLEVLERMGARVSVGENWIEATADAAASSRGRLKSLDADLNHIPDAAMTVAVLALFADGPSTLRNIASWRVKETDRITAMATELRKLGASVDEGPDSLRITPPKAGLTPNAAIDTYDDHRIAMCFSLAALGGVPITINDPGCVAKTFPVYFEVLASISESSGP